MKIFLHYCRALLLWTGGFVLVALLLALLERGGGWGPRLPAWLGIALILASFPAGIGVARVVFADGRVRAWGLAGLAGGLLVGVIGLFLAWNVFGPMVGESRGRPSEPVWMHLDELRAAIRESASVFDLPVEARGAELETNILGWHYVRRTDGLVLPALFGLIGVFAGFWGGRIRRREWRHLNYWALGVFLLLTNYLAGENGFEWVVLRSTGPAYFAADFLLIVPGVVVLILGWATALALFTDPPDSAAAS